MRAHAILRAVVALVLLVAAPAVARAQDPTAPPHVAAALTYTHPAGCKGEGALRSAVADVMGYDPFTPDAARKIHVTITREHHGLFVSRWGDGEGEHKPIVLPECGELIQQTGVSIALRIAPDRRREEPAVAPEPTPVREPPAAAPAPPPPAPQVVVVAPPVVPPPLPAPKAGMFDGPAGIGRAVAFAVAGTGIAVGTGFAVAAASTLSDVHHLDAALGSNSAACSKGGASCAQLDTLARQHDVYSNAAIGLMLGGAVTGAAAVVSIWVVRTPAHRVDVTPAAPGALAGVSLKGRW